MADDDEQIATVSQEENRSREAKPDLFIVFSIGHDKMLFR
jgi:hypothetical protein